MRLRLAAASTVVWQLFLLLWSPPARAVLTCLTCMSSPDSTQLDRFRVTTRLARPICPMETIQCDRNQDICVTVTMHIGGGEYWLGAGCDKRSNFPQNGGHSCQNVRTLARSVQLGYVHERRATQRVCICTRDLCNSAGGGSTAAHVVFVLLLSLLSLFMFLPSTH